MARRTTAIVAVMSLTPLFAVGAARHGLLGLVRGLHRSTVFHGG